MKVCTQCGGIRGPQPDEAFNKSKLTKDGLQSWCKECTKALNRKLYAEFPKAKKRARQERDVELRRKRIANGGCWTCLEKAEEGKKYCRRCLDRHGIVQQRLRVARGMQKKCKQCGADIPPESKSRCQPCLTYAKNWRQNLKVEAFERYGGPRCVCCGVTDLWALTLDHIDNDGAAHRKTMGSNGLRIYQWLKLSNYPSDLRLQVLCWNCNMGKHFNGGICPHQLKGVANGS